METGRRSDVTVKPKNGIAMGRGCGGAKVQHGKLSME